MTDIFIDTRTIGAWAQQPADELLWQYVTRQLGPGVGGTIKAYSDLSIYLYIAGKLDSAGLSTEDVPLSDPKHSIPGDCSIVRVSR